MNKWFRRAVGTVGLAGGMLLLGTGTAHADDATPFGGGLDDLLLPIGDSNSPGLSPDARMVLEPNTVQAGPALHAPTGQTRTEGLPSLGGLPAVSGLPTLDG